MDNVNCLGNETTLNECSFDGFRNLQCHIGVAAAVNCQSSGMQNNENSTIFSPKENSYCHLKRSAKGLRLKSHPKDFNQKLTY